MKKYKLNTKAHQLTLDNMVLQLRRDGYTAWRDSEYLYTDASVLAIGFAVGNPNWVILV